MEKLFSDLYSELHKNSYKNEDPLEKFLFTTKQNVILVFYIASLKNKQATLEDICFNISPKVISRSTVQNILKEGVRINFLQKETNPNDKRSKYYKLTKEALKLIEEWAYRQKDVFSQIDKLAG